MKQNKKKIIVIMLCFIVVVTIVIIALLNLFKPKETYTSSSNTTETIESLYCSADKSENAFFHSDDASREKNEVKISAKNGVIGDMQFTYTGDFSDTTVAKTNSDKMNYDYDKFMDQTSVRFGDLSPNFSVLKNQVVINLFFTDKTFTSETASLMFLSSADANNIKKYSLSTLKKSYESKNFSCKMSN